jgi:hypothetical protein
MYKDDTEKKDEDSSSMSNDINDEGKENDLHMLE